VDRFGLRFDPRLRDEVLARMQRMRIPWRVAYLPPILEPVRDPSGEIADIRVRPARDLDEVMGAFGRAGAGR
jgi:dipeptidyl-peptidase-3